MISISQKTKLTHREMERLAKELWDPGFRSQSCPKLRSQHLRDIIGSLCLLGLFSIGWPFHWCPISPTRSSCPTHHVTGSASAQSHGVPVAYLKLDQGRGLLWPKTICFSILTCQMGIIQGHNLPPQNPPGQGSENSAFLRF